jgi:putative ABC transport system permease protein
MSFRDDFEFAWKSLRKSPGFVAIAVITLALGLGLNAAIFSIVNAVLLKPLDLPNPHELVFVNGEMKIREVPYFPTSPLDWRDMQESADLLVGIAAYNTFNNTLKGIEGDAEQVTGAVITNNFFEIAGVKPFVGRAFNDADAAFSAADVPEGTPYPQNTFAPAKTALLSYELWQRRFGGRDDILGEVVDLGGNQVEIVGVMPKGFRFEMPPETNTNPEPDLFLPVRVDYENAMRDNVFFNLFGRLKPGVTIEQAQAQLDNINAIMVQQYEIKKSVGWNNYYRDLHSAITQPVRASVLILMAAVVFVLLIACANVANLLLVRASSRSRETAIRAALGGNQARLLRQMFLEAGLVAAGGALLGLILAEGGIRFLHALGPDGLPMATNIRLDTTVVFFTLVITVGSTILAGIVPALRMRNPNLVDELRERAGSSRSSGSKLFRDGMVVLEVALSFVLLVGAGLMLRSFVALQTADPGFNPQGVMTFNLNLPNDKYPSPDMQFQFFDQFYERVNQIPGAESAGTIGGLPLGGGAFAGRYATEENSGNMESYRQAQYRPIKGEYFKTMQTELMAGRLFSRDDELNALRYVIIDDVMAKKNFPDQNPVGDKLMIRFGPEPVLVEIIGVVRHQDSAEIREEGNETIYMTNEMLGFGPFGTWVVRSAADPSTLAGPIRNLVREMDSDVVIQQMQPMTDVVKESQAPTWFALSLISIFGAVALILASVGLYSVLAYVVRLRQSELGVRMTFGATPAKIFKLVVGRGIFLGAIGGALGIVVALSVTRLMQNLLVGVSPTDPVTFISIAVLFMGISFLASFIPAQRATRVDPVVSLRWE